MPAEVPHEYDLSEVDVFIVMDGSSRSVVAGNENDAVRLFAEAFGDSSGAIRVVKITAKMRPPKHVKSRNRGMPMTFGISDAVGKIVEAH